MRLLKKLRVNLDMSQRKLGEKAKVDASYICRAEKIGCPMYPVQAVRVAEALGWKGDPAELFEEVPEDELAAAH